MGRLHSGIRGECLPDLTPPPKKCRVKAPILPLRRSGTLKIAVTIGTRPEIIKMSPIIRLLKKMRLNYFLLHTGQHYSYNLDSVFFGQLELDPPTYNLRIGSGSHAEQTGRMMIGIEGVLRKERPSIVLVEGDTNTVLATALAASKLGIAVGHVEAGLRSGDRTMPEELNRIVTDHLSDFLFAPTQGARRNLIHEGIRSRGIYVTGNTITDALLQNIEIAKRMHPTISPDDLGPYAVVTVHRQENVENPERLKGIIAGLELVSEKAKLSIVCPAHPRTREALSRFGINHNSTKMRIIPPLGYLEFLKLELEANLILTDSGGVQEEACILRIPCVTLRDNTERPETVQVGANMMGGTNPRQILRTSQQIMQRKRTWKNPFGDGHAAEKIIEVLRSTSCSSVG